MRAEGKSYNEICEALGCTKSTVAYHCSLKEKQLARQRANREKEKSSISKKVDNFRNTKVGPGWKEEIQSSPKKQLRDKTKNFFRKKDGSERFNSKDVLNKFGNNPKCYLTGTLIDLSNPRSFSLDHIMPTSKGGKNTLENLGLATRDANMAKNDMLLEDFLELCKSVLTNHGYAIELKKTGD